MNDPTPFWSIDKPCEESLHWLQLRLSAAGLQLLRTFDLQDARHAASDCQCPHHGTDACDCRMVVALVYAGECPPVTLIIHGSNRKSWISVIDRPDQRADGAITLAIKRALHSDARSGT